MGPPGLGRIILRAPSGLSLSPPLFFSPLLLFSAFSLSPLWRRSPDYAVYLQGHYMRPAPSIHRKRLESYSLQRVPKEIWVVALRCWCLSVSRSDYVYHHIQRMDVARAVEWYGVSSTIRSLFYDTYILLFIFTRCAVIRLEEFH